MSATDRYTVRIRLVVVALATTLAALLATTIYRYGTSPTDENLFINPPSPVYVTEGAPAAGLDVGDLVMAVDDRTAVTLATFEDIRAGLADDTRVRLRVRRPSGSVHAPNSAGRASNDTAPVNVPVASSNTSGRPSPSRANRPSSPVPLACTTSHGALV